MTVKDLDKLQSRGERPGYSRYGDTSSNWIDWGILAIVLIVMAYLNF